MSDLLISKPYSVGGSFNSTTKVQWARHTGAAKSDFDSTLVVLFFVSHRAGLQMLYCVINHNILPRLQGQGGLPHQRPCFPAARIQVRHATGV